MFLIRDFTFDMNESEDEYLESCLTVRSANSSEMSQKLSVKSIFPNRSLRTLPHPVNPNLISQLEEIPFHEMNPQFQKKSKQFVEFVRHHSPIKELYGSDITGFDLGVLTEQYVNALNSGTMPSIETGWSSIVNTRNREAVSSAMKVYQEYMDSHICIPGSEEELMRIHERAQKRAIDKYATDSIETSEMGQDLLEEWRQKLQQEIAIFEENKVKEGMLHRYLDKNRKACQKDCERQINELYREIQNKVSDGQYLNNYGEYENDKNRVIELYRRRTQEYETVAHEVLKQFLESKSSEAKAVLNACTLNSQRNEEIKREQEKLRREQARREQIEAERKREERAQEQRNNAYQQQLQSLKDTLDSTRQKNQERFEQLKSAKNSEIRTLEDKHSLEIDAYERRINDYRKHNEQTQNRIKNLQNNPPVKVVKEKSCLLM
eukprot:gb/GECH01000299.1/.p1 GENE.gb/GECH01000299.1/~~gb/GECH01000299.1/.p1  ORF type:complete len:435 (+),score=117.88 gb/GECH01000299.1/:1-1305(+)